tara:strand:- start:235 stop:828 length:594 start_codon:yes stop_codon:yes gene_type:complete
MFKIIIAISAILILSSCGGQITGQHRDNVERLDKIHGKCDNPYRNLGKLEKKICKDKERAAGPDGEIDEPISLNDVLDAVQGKSSEVVYAGAYANTFLWNGSISVLEQYSLKTVDSQGGFIATDWILKKDAPNQRCQIKINVVSNELLSNGVKVKIICEELIGDEWFGDNKLYLNEEKNLTLKILEKANQLSSQQPE